MILTMFEKAYEVAENSSVGDLIKAQMPDDLKKYLAVQLEDGTMQDLFAPVAKDQVVKVKVLDIAENGKVALSIKKAMEQPQQAAGAKTGFDGQKPSRPRSPRPAPAPRYNSLDFAQKHKDEPKSFEDMMAKFKQTSDDKMSDLKHNIDNKRGGGRRGYSK